MPWRDGTARTRRCAEEERTQPTNEEPHCARRHRPRAESFRTMELPDHRERPPRAQRTSGQRSHDPYPRARSLLPEGHQQHLEIAANYPKLNVGYTGSSRSRPIPITRAKSSANSVGAQWPFLSDPERIVQKDLDIRSTRTPRTTRMIPAHARSEPGADRAQYLQRLLVLGSALVPRPSGTICALSLGRLVPIGHQRTGNCVSAGTPGT